MKLAWMVLPVLALSLTLGLNAEAKRPSKTAMKAFTKECKQENPTMNKKDLRKCAKAKAKAAA